MLQKIQTFINTCLRRIYKIRWPDKISNEDLWERAGKVSVAKQFLQRKWGGFDTPLGSHFKHHTTDPDLESTGKDEEKPASQLLGARH